MLTSFVIFNTSEISICNISCSCAEPHKFYSFKLHFEPLFQLSHYLFFYYQTFTSAAI